MEIILDNIYKAIGYLFLAAIIYLIAKLANEESKKKNYKSVLLKGFIYCAGIALFTSLALGRPSCEQYDPDPLFGGCEYHANDGYTPSTNQRIGNFAYFFLLLYVPVIVGALNNRKK